MFQLYAVEDRPNHEVCDRLGISESNLWVMLHRARKHLRAELADWLAWSLLPPVYHFIGRILIGDYLSSRFPCAS